MCFLCSSILLITICHLDLLNDFLCIDETLTKTENAQQGLIQKLSHRDFWAFLQRYHKND